MSNRNILQALQGAAGAAGGATLDIDEVFSTFLYDGTNVAQTITNNIDLTEGGLVWTKQRSDTRDHQLYDTARGADKALESSDTIAQHTGGAGVIAFNSNGFNLGTGSRANQNGEEFVSWTFRKAPKFFDVVKFTGDGSSNRSISHSLGSTPGFIIIKDATNISHWFCWHNHFSSLSSGSGYMMLNSTNAVVNTTGVIDTVTSTSFNVTGGATNASGATIIAYVFAHNNSDGEFGPDSDQDIIKCGSISGFNGRAELGFEPQWVLLRETGYTGNWALLDVMRGWTPVNSNDDAYLFANLANAEANYNGASFDATGFNYGQSGENWIYMAIRRGPLFVPEDATKVFEPTAYTGDGTISRQIGSINPVDLVLVDDLDNNSDLSYYGTAIWDRLRGENLLLRTNSTDAESSGWQNTYFNLDQSGGWRVGDLQGGQNYHNKSSSDMISWTWKRAPGYFDVVCFTGNGQAGRTVNHNLGVEPEMVWLKCRSVTEPWRVFHKDLGIGSSPYSKILQLNENSAAANAGDFQQAGMTSSVITLGGELKSNGSGRTYVAYLFATVAGVSKVGSVTHSGSSTDVDCGFSNGARFVLLKRTDATGSWVVFDTARGIVAGNDPYLKLNSSAAQVTTLDQLDPLSSGFQITGDFNDGDYIFYAIA